MKAIAIEAFGRPAQLKLMDLPTPQPEDDEVLIENTYAAVNPVDWKIREGLLQGYRPNIFPLVPGWDAIGRVAAVGRDVIDFAAGDRVWTSCPKDVIQHGTYAEFVTAKADLVALAPANLSDAEAGSIPLVALTAWQGLFEFAGLAPGRTVLVHAGAGGVGSVAIQLAKHAGATVLTTSSAHNHGYVAGLGADHVIDYQAEDFVAAVRGAYPDGVDVVLDAVGGEVQQRSFGALRKGGVLASIVGPPDDGLARAHGVKAGAVFYRDDGGQLREIAAMVESGAIRAPAVEEMPLAEAASAHRKSEAGHVRGKIVLKVR